MLGKPIDGAEVAFLIAFLTYKRILAVGEFVFTIVVHVVLPVLLVSYRQDDLTIGDC